MLGISKLQAMCTFVRLLCVMVAVIAVQTVEGTLFRNGSITDICNASSSLENITLNLTGDETLNINENCHVENAFNLTIQGLPEARPTIWCSRKNGRASSTAFTFNNTYLLTIKNINFVGCGGILTKDDKKSFNNSFWFFFSEGQAAVILCTFCSHLSLVNVSFSVNNGYAFAGINLWGHSLLDGITVNGKDDPHLPFNATMCEQPEFKYSCGGRGVLLMFVDSIMKTEDSTVLVNNSNFYYNLYTVNKTSENLNSSTCSDDIFTVFKEPIYKSYTMPDVGALTVLQIQTTFKAYVKVFNSKFANNHGLCYGAVLAVINTPSSLSGELMFQNCHFYNNSPIQIAMKLGQNHIAHDITIYMRFRNLSSNSHCVSLINSSFSCSMDEKVKSTCITLTHFPGSQGENGHCIVT